MNTTTATPAPTNTPRKFVIDQSKWRAGNTPTIQLDCKGAIGKGPTRMENSLGFQCCLGQIGEQLGAPKAELCNAITPYACHSLTNSFLTDRGGNSTLASDAMTINDDPALSNAERRAQLTAVFATYGYELEFIGEPVPYKI
jgi:hypothetical protein